MVREIVKMLAEGADIPTIRKTFPGASKTTADHIRTDSRASAYIIPDGHRMADGDVRGGNGGPLYDALMELGLSGAMRSSWDGLTRLPEGVLVGVENDGVKTRERIAGSGKSELVPKAGLYQRGLLKSLMAWVIPFPHAVSSLSVLCFSLLLAASIQPGLYTPLTLY